jgi:hypothetical protein
MAMHAVHGSAVKVFEFACSKNKEKNCVWAKIKAKEKTNNTVLIYLKCLQFFDIFETENFKI